jgi:hypothetical protein
VSRRLAALIVLLCLADPVQALDPIPDKLVALTFDDASKSHHSVARPLLLKHKFGATFNSFRLIEVENHRVRLFVNDAGALASAEFRERFDGGPSSRITVVEVMPQKALSLLFCCVHLHSRATKITPEGLNARAIDVASNIRAVEKDIGHTRTVLVGDFNLTPYAEGMITSRGFHGLMTRDLLRTVAGYSARKDYPPFYNPMWSCLGDGIEPNSRRRSPGTYFFAQTADPLQPFWHLYDQLLLRHDIMDSLTHLEILQDDGAERFTGRDGRPRATAISDHLPLYFILDY